MNYEKSPLFVRASGTISAREAAISTALNCIREMEVTKGKPYSIEYEEVLRSMTDEQFDRMIKAFAEKRDFIPFVSNGFTEPGVSIDNNFKIAPKFGFKFTEKIILTDPSTGLSYESKYEALNMMPNIRRQVQTGESGISVPGSRTVVDDLTGQVTGDSAAMKITNPEINGMKVREQWNSLVEFVAVRANQEAYNKAYTQIVDTGHCRLNDVISPDSRAKVTDTFSVFMSSMHFANNI